MTDQAERIAELEAEVTASHENINLKADATDKMINDSASDYEKIMTLEAERDAALSRAIAAEAKAEKVWEALTEISELRVQHVENDRIIKRDPKSVVDLANAIARTALSETETGS